MAVRWRRIALVAICGLAAVQLTTGCSPGQVNNAADGYRNQGYGQNLPNGGDNPPPDEETATLTASTSPTAGLIVTDKGGNTLYRYDRDTSNPPRSNCSGDCAAEWPPAEVKGSEITTRGISQRMVNKIKRPDGVWQLTLGGMPLYRYRGDKRQGEVNGQSLGQVWYAVDPTGNKATPNSAPVQQQGFTGTKWGPLSPADKNLIIGVRLAGLWETPAGQQAADRGKNRRVREIGAEIARQHLVLDKDARTVAAQLGVQIPNVPTPEQQGWLNEMNGLGGQQFDETFVKRLRQAHGKIYPVIGAVRGSTQNTVVRAFAQRANVFVDDHMSFLESTGLVTPDDLPPPPPVAPAPKPPPGR